MNLTTRLKASKSMIRLVRPFESSTSDLIYPIFVREDGRKFEIPSMKGQEYLSLEDAVSKCRQVVELGVPAVMVFGVIKGKDSDASVALQKNGFHSQIFSRLKKEFGDKLLLISNLCLCDFTKDEYCVYSEKGRVLNEKTAAMLAKIALIHAEAGADVIAPAAMADGQVMHIRSALDNAGLESVSVMSYIKIDSCLFQPFYVAMSQSETPRVGIDSSKFRVDAANEKMFMQKVELDISEGADMIIVKPALTNLDLISKVKQTYPNIPIAAYQVSGEYAMIKLLCEHSHMNEMTLIMETLNSIKRAGADMTITYNAMDVASLTNSRHQKIV
jgi:porphobilinogen synthase